MTNSLQVVTALGALVLLRRARDKVRRWHECTKMLENFRILFDLPVGRMEAIAEDLADQMARGLRGEEGGLFMSPCYLSALPSGRERGVFYAIDLGGTTFRALRVLLGDRIGEVDDYEIEEFVIPKDIQRVTDTNLTDFIADRFCSFVDRCDGRGGNGEAGGEGEGSDRELEAPPSRPLPLVVGFCFSFAFTQTSPTTAFLSHWTKGFSGTGLIGTNVVAALEGAFERRGRSVRVAAVANDTVATLVASAYVDSRTRLGVILGTGTNAAVLEPQEAIRDEAWKEWSRGVTAVEPGTETGTEAGTESADRGEAADDGMVGERRAVDGGKVGGDRGETTSNGGGDGGENASNGGGALARSPAAAAPPATAAANPLSGLCIVNTEWGDAWSEYFPTSPEDAWIDAASPNPGRGLLEKQVSGMYMGEAARRLLVGLARDGALFGGSGGECPKALRQEGCFSSSDVARVHADDTDDLQETRRIVSRFGSTNRRAREIVRTVCHLVARRSARLSAAAVVATLRHARWAGDCDVVVAFDGSVFSKFAGYRAMVAEALADLLGIEAAEHVLLRWARDGSGLGAAYLAAAAVRAESEAAARGVRQRVPVAGAVPAGCA